MIDSSEEKDEPLLEGRVTQNVVKVGNTVRRPLSKNANFVHLLLQNLEKIGFNCAPKFLGIDESNREILSYIEGYVPPDLNEWSDTQLIAAFKLIRKYHDATNAFECTKGEEVICHNDLSPCNTVMIDRLPVALIDFDSAAPGSRVSDLAYAIWMWCSLGEEEISVKEQARKIKLTLDAYGNEARKNFIDKIIEIQREHIRNYQENVNRGLRHWENAVSWGQRCLTWVVEHKTELEKIIR